MNNSISFDRAAGYYDQTRSIPEPVVQKGVEAILGLAGLGGRLLDVGTGTGRISVPLLEAGADLVGCDLSAAMLGRLQEKQPAARILQADATRLPFPTDHFDVVLTVHVLHLVAGWQEALREFRRVLQPGGAYLNVQTYAHAGFSAREQMRKFWRGWVEAQGVPRRQPGMRDPQQIRNELKAQGAELSEVEVVRYSRRYTLRGEVELIRSRVYSDAWQIPDDVYEASLPELQNWVDREYGDWDMPREEEVKFVIDVARFGG